MMWQMIAYVSSGVTLAAFVVAAGAWIYSRRTQQKLELIQSAPESERTGLVQDALEFFRIDTTGLTRQQRYDLALTQIQARASRFKLSAFVIVIISILAASVTAFAISRSSASSDDRANAHEKQEVDFMASNETGPFAIKARFTGKAIVKPGSIEIAVASAELSFPELAPDGGDRYVDYLRVGLACSEGDQWKDVSQSKKLTVGKTLTAGDFEDLGRFDLTIPRSRGMLVAGCWLVFNVATKLGQGDPEVGLSHAHTSRDLF